LKRVDAEIASCESCHHDEIEKRKKYKVWLVFEPSTGRLAVLTYSFTESHNNWMVYMHIS